MLALRRIIHLPNRRVREFRRYEDAEEQVEYSLLTRVRDNVTDVALDARHDLAEPEAFLLTHTLVMCNRTAVLDTDAVAHLVVQAEEDLEEL